MSEVGREHPIAVGSEAAAIADTTGWRNGVSEAWRGTWVVTYREVLRFVTERSRLVSSFAFPLAFLVIFGAGFSNRHRRTGARRELHPVHVPGHHRHDRPDHLTVRRHLGGLGP